MSKTRTKAETMDRDYAELKEELSVIHNTIKAMNSYYAKTITIINSEINFISKSHKKIDEIYDKLCQKDDAIELGKKARKKK